MRILFVINCFAMAGAEKLVFDLARSISNDCEYIAIAGLYDRKDATEKQMIQTLSDYGIHSFLLHKGVKTDRLRTIQALRTIIKKQNIGVIHAHCSVPMLLAKCAGKSLGVPVVCTVHNTRGYSRKRELLTGWMVGKYISIGQAAEDYMQYSLGIPAKKISRIYNAVNCNEFLQVKNDPLFWKQWGLSADQKIILNVGRFTEVKNQICLLKAIKECKDKGEIIQAVFLGDYSAEQSTYPSLIKYIKDNSLETQIFFLGVQNNVADFLHNADCFVMTSIYEGLSVAFLEAVLSGIPIISTDMPFVRELNQLAPEEYPCASVVPQNDYHAISSLLCEGKYVSQNIKTISIFNELFSMETFSKRHMEIYREVRKGVSNEKSTD